MDLPDCPPGTEGYEDSVVQVPHRKPDSEESTKAEQEFFEHLNSLKINVDDGSLRFMVERKGRDISGMWIYLCFPCAAVCSGESVLQTHISGKRHKAKLAMKTVWPVSIFDNHPYVQSEKGNRSAVPSNKMVQKLAAEADLHNTPHSELDEKFGRFRRGKCHILTILEGVKAPIIGLEYLIEHPPEEEHHEPAYICVLCLKQGHPRTIVNHLTCFWHRYAYVGHHYQKACALLAPYTRQQGKREGVALVLNRLAQRIEDSFGRMKPLLINKHEYEREKEAIHKWVSRGFHPSDKTGPSFENVVDVDLMESLSKQTDEKREKDPSPPVVAAPTKPLFNSFHRPTGRNERRHPSADSLSDISDDDRDSRKRQAKDHRGRSPDRRRARVEPPSRQTNHPGTFKSRYVIRHIPEKKDLDENNPKAGNYDHKVKLAGEKRQQTEDAMNKTLSYHEKNPEKHPLYPDEWKKFWNRRYKELQAEGKEPQKHDFKSEWIVFWTARMKELHIKELQSVVDEIYRKFNLTPPDVNIPKQPERKKTPPRQRSPERRRRTPEPRRRSPVARHRSPVPRHRSPVPRSRSPIPRRRSPEPRRDPRRLSPVETNRKDFRRSPERRGPVIRWPSPARPSAHRNLSRSPVHSGVTGGSQSPLSRRESALRNRSPVTTEPNTVLISDDELKTDNITSPWNSDAESLGSLPDADTRSHVSYAESTNSRSRPRPHDYPRATGSMQDLGPKDDVVAMLRLLVALEDYLGSLGPKIVDLLTEALKMEKEKANSSEQLMLNETAMALLETSKEKLKGAVQAGLVPHAATAAVRAAIVRVASLLHTAEKKAAAIQKDKAKAKPLSSSSAVPVAGVGAVDRDQIAAQMAAALIAQGKTDVSPEELAQLVDAVVGMAEAKKREAESKKDVPQTKHATPSTSALQMLQSAYDENEPKKPVDKEEPPDAMDGLSDSDLETLLKNFNELSAEEQHSLIAYLKKLEAKEPRRVERLREYVSAAAVRAAPAPVSGSGPVSGLGSGPVSGDRETSLSTPGAPPTAPVSHPTLSLDSDDDDYTVEDVFNSANKKVTENQIRQEMEIVKKSLEETKRDSPPPASSPAPGVNSNLISQFSAANLLALVQASISSVTSASTADVVTSVSEPRSFGDSQGTPVMPQALLQPPVTPLTEFNNEPFGNQHFDNQNPNFNQNFENQNTNFNQNFDNQNANFNQNFDNQNPNFNQNFDNQNQNPNFNQNFDNQNPNFNQNFDNQNPNFNQNSNFNQNFDMGYNYNNQGPNVGQDYGGPDPNMNQDFGMQNTNMGQNYGMGDQNMEQDYNNPNMEQDFYNQNQNNFNRNQNMNNFNQNTNTNNKQNFNQNRGRNNRNQQRGGRGGQNFKSNANKPNDNFNKGQQRDNKPPQNATNSTLLRPPYMNSGSQPRFNNRGGGGGGNFNPRASSGNFQRGGNQRGNFNRGRGRGGRH